MSDSKVVLGTLSIACSSNFSKSLIFWDMNKFESWLVIGYHGLTFCHSTDNNPDPSVRNSRHIYKIVGVDDI